MKKILNTFAAVLMAGVIVANAQQQSASERLKKPVTDEGLQTTRLAPVTVYGTADSAFASGFMPDVTGTQIYAGKKTTVTDLEKLPSIVANNYREAFALTPGLFVSEVQNRGIVNLTYRGVGDPHESQDVLLLQDGIPIQNDIFGYATAYYSTPLQYVKQIEFIRGGSALLYGPQPGPVINYVSVDPVPDKGWDVSTDQVFGSYGLYDTFTKVSGTSGQFGYVAAYTHNQADGDRINGGYGIDGGNVKMIWRPGDATKLTFGLDAFEGFSEEPGRLTLAQFNANRYQTRTAHDVLNWNRYIGSLKLEHRFSEDTLLTAKTWGGYTSRYSTRERFNGARVSQNNSSIDLQEFYSIGLDTRVRHNWQAWENEHTLTAGFTFYYNDSPRFQKRSNAGDLGGYSGNTRYIMDRYTTYGALFAENKFSFGKLSLIPSIRGDIISTEVNEPINVGKTTAPLITLDQTETVVLFGFGIEYDLGASTDAYFNFSQGYKPPGYDSLAPSGNALAATDLQSGQTFTYEVGVRGTPLDYLTYDTSLFWIDYEDQFGNVAVGALQQSQNVGNAHYRGWEAAMEFDLFGFYDSLQDRRVTRASKGPKDMEEAFDSSPSFVERYGNLILYGNVQLLDAEFYSGPNKGLTPAYAPGYLIKFGPMYNYKDRVKVSFLGQIVGDQFWQDNNTAGIVGTNEVEGFAVWDLSAEAKVYKDMVTVLFGVNNVFDENYYSRVRSDGIEPAQRRNFYGGVRVAF